MDGRDWKSRKRSAANSASRRRERFVFFLDQCLGNKVVAEALRDAGYDVQLLGEHFPPNTPDDQWLSIVGSRQWILIGKDKRIRRRPNELAALIQGNVRSFTLTAGNMRGKDMANAVMKALPAMEQFVRDFQPPFVATITATGKVKMLLRRKDITHELKRRADDT